MDQRIIIQRETRTNYSKSHLHPKRNQLTSSLALGILSVYLRTQTFVDIFRLGALPYAWQENAQNSQLLETAEFLQMQQIIAIL